MDLNEYKSLNQHVESLLPKLQQQAMQQPISGDTQSPMQLFLPVIARAAKKGMGKNLFVYRQRQNWTISIQNIVISAACEQK